MVIFVMNWNWLTSTKNQVEYLTTCGHEVIIVDNCSTYKPLLDWYASNPCKVISTEGVTLNTYNRFVWEMDLHNIHTKENYYAVTDSDLGVEQIPKDFAQVLIGDIERNPGIIKSGFSLETNDLPNTTYANRYREGEARNFSNQDKHGFYDIPVDTTFAVYSKERCENLHKLWRSATCEVPDSFLDNRYFYRSHRSPRPYTAKHLPWYMDINNLTEEQLYHIDVSKHGSVLYFKQVYRNELKEKYNMIIP